MLAAALVLTAAQWSPLFDGKTLNGWKQLNGKATYSVEKGQIVGRTVVGSPNSFLCTEKFYGDFELELEVMTDPKLNSGIQIRSMSVPGYQEGRVHGYQIEVDPSSRGWSGGLYDESRRGWLQDLSKNEKGQKAFRAGKWNKYRIVAKGDHFEAWVNGIKTTDHHDNMTAWGMIGLQVHQADAAGMEVRWKNLRIKDLGMPYAEPPKGGKWLLKTEADRANWVAERGGAPCPWQWIEGGLETTGGTGDLNTKETMGSSRLHIEFVVDDNGKQGQENGNSGVYIQRRYELQVLNSAPRQPAHDECGGFYGTKAPDFAMAFKPYQWQTYDIEFHEAKWDGDKKIEDAWVTVYHNGTLIHNKLKFPRETASGNRESPEQRPLRLQNHGNQVRYRNIWIAPLK